MILSDRYNVAKSSYISIIGVVVAFIIGIFLVFVPSMIWPDIFIPAEDSILIFNYFIGGAITWLIVAIGIFLFVGTSTVITGLIYLLMGRYFDEGMDKWLKILLVPPIIIWTVYKMFFGDYFRKWYFLKVLFRPKEVAKDLLLED